MRQLLFWLFFLCGTTTHAQYFDTLHLYYAVGIAGIPPAGKHQLDSLLQYQKDSKLLIYSYADYLGSEKRNQHLSDARALQVKQYLMEKGITAQQIMECTGLGQVPGTGGTTGDAYSRRTDIFIRRQPSTVALPGEKEMKSAAQPLKIKTGAQGIPITTEEEAPAPKVSKIDLSTLKVNDAVRLEHLGFYTGRVDMLPEAYPELEHLYQVLDSNPKLKVRLEGHVCCCVYPDGFFKDTPTWGLSVQRAYVVYQHLIKKGIAAERLSYEGFGRTRPIRDNEKTSEEGQVNRRVEVRILEK